MMQSKLPAALMVVLSLSGCGTIANLASGAPEVYGGVQKDVDFAANPAQGKGDLLILWLADVALSGIGDTLTLPYILYREERIDREAAWKNRHDPRPVQFSVGGVASPPR